MVSEQIGEHLELTRQAVIVTRVANTETFTVMPTFSCLASGLECVALSSWQKWLNSAVGAIVKQDTDIIANFVADVRKILSNDNDRHLRRHHWRKLMARKQRQAARL